jgi:hypothetical protein
MDARSAPVSPGNARSRNTGLHKCRSDELNRMMRDFVAERRAAGQRLPEAVHALIAG